jgi:hypothetical protein
MRHGMAWHGMVHGVMRMARWALKGMRSKIASDAKHKGTANPQIKDAGSLSVSFINARRDQVSLLTQGYESVTLFCLYVRRENLCEDCAPSQQAFYKKHDSLLAREF